MGMIIRDGNAGMIKGQQAGRTATVLGKQHCKELEEDCDGGEPGV